MTKEEFDILYEDYMSVTPKTVLWNLIKKLNKLNPENILEIGTWYGGSSKIFAWFCDKNVGKYIGIDLNPNIASHVLDNNLCPNHFIKSDHNKIGALEYTKKLIEGHGSGKFDFIYMDTNECRNGIVSAIKNYYPLLSSKGIFAVHDTSGCAKAGFNIAFDTELINSKSELHIIETESTDNNDSGRIVYIINYEE